MARNMDDERAVSARVLGEIVDALALIALTETPEVRELLVAAAKSAQTARAIIASSIRDTSPRTS